MVVSCHPLWPGTFPPSPHSPVSLLHSFPFCPPLSCHRPDCLPRPTASFTIAAWPTCVVRSRLGRTPSAAKCSHLAKSTVSRSRGPPPRPLESQVPARASFSIGHHPPAARGAGNAQSQETRCVEAKRRCSDCTRAKQRTVSPLFGALVQKGDARTIACLDASVQFYFKLQTACLKPPPMFSALQTHSANTQRVAIEALCADLPYTSGHSPRTFAKPMW